MNKQFFIEALLDNNQHNKATLQYRYHTKFLSECVYCIALLSNLLVNVESEKFKYLSDEDTESLAIIEHTIKELRFSLAVIRGSQSSAEIKKAEEYFNKVLQELGVVETIIDQKEQEWKNR